MAARQQGFTLIEMMIVVAIVGILAAISIPAYQSYTIRSKVSELVQSAGACKASFNDYYQATGKLPANATTAGCTDIGTASSLPPTVVNGEILVVANGKLGLQLGSTANTFAMKPDCGAAGCNGAAIKTWNCTKAFSSTTIDPKYLPATCRG
ncbi:MAG TPA: pilin [Usitatibacter sp.]|nr:pilin [Usitatibacter sp.]